MQRAASPSKDLKKVFVQEGVLSYVGKMQASESGYTVACGRAVAAGTRRAASHGDAGIRHLRHSPLLALAAKRGQT